ncbi:hypothetical protein [Aquimarina litoralis]|uniref:hypothetical protein n=1 Tax=Aquimarina litoralis TaxID=584605 RepID=UPI001C5730D3|nr:hypothetical protein [Aquimarina litoralis]MBW1298418.1 hypothetical protein [Aquimarina litoralis]
MQIKLIKHPYVIFWSSIPILLLVSHYKANQTLDINIHDTYYVFSQQQLCVFLSVFFGITGLVYWLLKKFNFKTIPILAVLHIFFSVGVVLGNSIQELLVDYFLGKRYYTITDIPYASTLIFILMISIGQIIFLLNVFLAIVNGRNKKSLIRDS